MANAVNISRQSTIQGFRAALESLSTAQKTTKGAPAYSRYINRPLGRPLAALAFAWKMTPNQVTAISAGLTFFGLLIVALTPPQAFTSFAAVLLLMGGYALDSADGQLARLRGGGSFSGEWLDHIVDAFKANLLHISVLVCWWQYYDMDAAWYLVPLCYTVASSVFFFAVILTDQLRRQHRGSPAMFLQGEGHSSAWYSLAVLPTDYGLMIVVFGLLWLPQAFITVYVALLIANVIFLGLALPKWFGEVRAFAQA